MSRFTLIEETALLQNDTPQDDFAAHFYVTRYDRLKGIPQTDFATLRKSAWDAIEYSMGKNAVALGELRQAGKNPLAWSMNWYRLRDTQNKPYKLTDNEKSLIISDFEDLKERNPFNAQIHIFHRETSDMLLIAVSLELQ